MALSGVRDMSGIEQPPQDRQPLQTYVLEHDWGVLADAMRREIAAADRSITCTTASRTSSPSAGGSASSSARR